MILQGTYRRFHIKSGVDNLPLFSKGRFGFLMANRQLFGYGNTLTEAKRECADLVDRFVYTLIEDPNRPVNPTTLPTETIDWQNWLMVNVSVFPQFDVNKQKYNISFSEEFWRTNYDVYDIYIMLRNWRLNPADLAYGFGVLYDCISEDKNLSRTSYKVTILQTALERSLKHPNTMVQEAAKACQEQLEYSLDPDTSK